LIAGRDPEFHRWMGEGSPDPQPTAVIEVDGEVIGWVDHDHDPTRSWLEPHQCNVGYHVLAGHRGRGFARRAVLLLLDGIAQEGLYREATFLIDAENEASLLVARAAGAREVRRFDVDGRVQVLLARATT
jgi:RimJ/RimL family protein N-acetyltransferase